MGFNYEVNQDPGPGEPAVYRLSGDLDNRVQPPEGRLVLDLDPVAPGRDVVLDASELEFLDSTGIRHLLDVRSAVVEQGGALQLRGARPVVKRVVEVTGLTDALGVVD
ncbi:MAG: STAS domain-containing protein [Actinomycetota bacterium]|nr:STAS domain-containing protein [Actinomycetota bacterium]